MRTIIIGGPGRSGTTYVANRIGTHLQCAHFFDIELKILSENDGLSDLRHVLCDHYSPPRAMIAIRRFQQLFAELSIGSFGQPELAGGHIDQMRDAALELFLSSFRKGNEYRLVTRREYNASARKLLFDLKSIAAFDKPSAEYFVEKTPHNSLNIRFIHDLLPDMKFIHVVRDPRAIAMSLLDQVWGPNEIEDACYWVGNYLDSWAINKEVAQELGVLMLEIRIEDLVSEPKIYSDVIQDFVGISKNEHIFFDSSPHSLNGWLRRLTSRNLEILDCYLRPWIEALGYPTVPEPISEGSS